MNKTMKRIMLAVCAVSATATLAACSGDKKETTSAGGSASGGANAANSAAAGESAGFTPVAGTTYDTGMFTVTVPNGWLAVPASDLFDEYEGDKDPTALTLVKDGKEDWDSLDHAWLKITIYKKDSLVSSKSFYDDAKDMSPVTVSGFKCDAFSCTSSGYPYVILEGSNDKNDISFSLLTKNDNNSADFNDADVQTILTTVVIK